MNAHGPNTARTDAALARVGAAAAILGAIVFLVSTLAHPGGADPNDFAVALIEYAESEYWVAIHLVQFAGIALLAIGLVGLAAALEEGPPAALGRLGVAGASAAIAAYAAVQGVDGVANHVLVHRWVDATESARPAVFEGAFAVRQVELGLTSLFSFTLGSTLAVFGLAIALSSRYPTSVGVIGIGGGLAGAAIGLEQAVHGFSDLAITAFMVVGTADLGWAVVVAVLTWRLAPRLESAAPLDAAASAASVTPLDVTSST